jgi:hypothetical protein
MDSQTPLFEPFKHVFAPSKICVKPYSLNYAIPTYRVRPKT